MVRAAKPRRPGVTSHSRRSATARLPHTSRPKSMHAGVPADESGRNVLAPSFDGAGCEADTTISIPLFGKREQNTCSLWVGLHTHIVSTRSPALHAGDRAQRHDVSYLDL